VIDPLLRSSEHLRRAGYRVVVLDPGHGGKDNGTKDSTGYTEKAAVLDIAKRIRSYLVDAGVSEVYLTRDDDHFIELAQRCRLAKKYNADVFVSIHLNASRSSKPHGVETFAMTKNGFKSTHAKTPDQKRYPGNRHDAPSSLLAYAIQDAYIQKMHLTDRGVKRARFAVLREAPCPAVLTECGFMSNLGEAAQLRSPAYRRRVAETVGTGILNYLDSVKRAHLSAD
jgi:N-acetylmuramoyl-L-alanine amidase